MTLFDQLGALFGSQTAPEDIGIAPEQAEPGSDAGKATDALREVIDPEIGINIVDLGLVYGLLIDEQSVLVTMTMTSPACPLSDTIERHVRYALERVFPEREIEIQLVWRPAWTSDRMTRAAKQMLGVGD